MLWEIGGEGGTVSFEQWVDIPIYSLVQYGTFLQESGVEINWGKKVVIVIVGENPITNALQLGQPLWNNRPRYVQSTKHNKFIQKNSRVSTGHKNNPKTIEDNSNTSHLLKKKVFRAYFQ